MGVAVGLGGRLTYFRYKATSGDIVDNTVEQLDLINIGIAVGTLFVYVLELEITLGVIYPPPMSIIFMKNR